MTTDPAIDLEERIESAAERLAALSASTEDLPDVLDDLAEEIAGLAEEARELD